ncbi:hypothetical protein DDT91_07890 [Algoriphagus sp. AK58]|nr:hypothetical protein [Algoriphagus sp. AK58]
MPKSVFDFLNYFCSKKNLKEVNVDPLTLSPKGSNRPYVTESLTSVDFNIIGYAQIKDFFARYNRNLF